MSFWRQVTHVVSPLILDNPALAPCWCASRRSARLPPAVLPRCALQRIGLAVVFTVSLVISQFAVEAQQPGKLYRVGILTNKISDAAEARLWQAFRSGLRECGWIEGQNILIEFRAAEGNTARLPELAAELVPLQVDLIVARASIWVQAAKEATTSIPIVFLTHADPVGTGHVASLASLAGTLQDSPS